ncbi:unnamed protein product, partial [Owenia fusiformis]
MTSYCDRYIEKRPLANSLAYKYLEQGYILGGPHYSTLDAYEYTFNGYGEYMLLWSKTGALVDIMLQIRTSIADTVHPDGKQAVYISGVAGRVGDGPRLQAYLSSDAMDVDVVVDEDVYKPGDVIHGAAVAKTNGSVVLAFAGDITVIAEAKNRALALTLQVPLLLQESYFRGLMGNFDGVDDNDIVDSRGALFDTHLLSNEDIYRFGESWSLRFVFGPTNAAKGTLFSIYPQEPDNANSYFRPDFNPYIVDPITLSASELAHCVLYNNTPVSNACLFDMIMYEDPLAASRISSQNEAFDSINERLSDGPPIFLTVLERIEAKANQLMFIPLAAYDRYSQQVSITVSLTSNTGEVDRRELITNESPSSPGAYEATFQWLPGSDIVQLEIIATDSSGLYDVMRPTLILCACNHEGLCHYDLPKGGEGTFRYASCQCYNGWSGESCSDDLDGCATSPCFGGCKDRTPKEVSDSADGLEF